MIVRVARRAAQSAARSVTVAADDATIVAACAAHGVAAVLTGTHHASGSDRLAEAARLLGLPDIGDRRQRPGRRADDRPGADRCLRRAARAPRRLRHEHRRASDRERCRLRQSEHRQGGARRRRRGAVLLARAGAVAARPRRRLRSGSAGTSRRFATSASMPIAPTSCSAIRCSRPARSSRSSSSSSCGCSGMASASRSMSATARPASASTPLPISRRHAPCSRRMAARVLPERRASRRPPDRRL